MILGLLIFHRFYSTLNNKCLVCSILISEREARFFTIEQDKEKLFFYSYVSRICYKKESEICIFCCFVLVWSFSSGIYDQNLVQYFVEKT